MYPECKVKYLSVILLTGMTDNFGQVQRIIIDSRNAVDLSLIRLGKFYFNNFEEYHFVINQ